MDYQILPFPSDRNVIVDAGYLGIQRHVIYGLLEIDVTQARQLIRAAAEETGERLSFTAFLVASLARAIAANPRVQAYRDWRGRLVVFQDVDVVTLIESKAGAVAIPHILRAANRRGVHEISAEIRAVQSGSKKSAQSGGLVALASRVPRFVRMLFYWAMRKNPHWFKGMQGTTILTSVGMFGKGSGWGLTFLPYHNLGLTVGGIAQKPGVHNGEIAIREYLNLTIAFDHDFVDGAPAARFARSLIDLIESAAVLSEG
ncbi:MAG: 2-oxo acid dehydrogenase subunit E2 [Chloroflexota bacterium]